MSKSRSKRDEQNRRDMILVLILVFVCVALFGVGTLISRDVKQGSILTMFGGGGSQSVPQSTATPSPTPMPTETPTPTRLPMKTPARNSPSNDPAQTEGLGVSMQEIQSVYENAGFRFNDDKIDDDRIHSLGKTANGLAAVELTGPDVNVQAAAVVIYLAADQPEHLKDSLNYMTQMIKTVLPDWQDGTKWLYTNVGQLAASKTRPQEIGTISSNIRILLKITDTPSLIILRLETAQIK